MIKINTNEHNEMQNDRDVELSFFCLIITYNGESYIRKCIKNLKYDIPEDRIIIVDNCSTDHTMDIIEQEFPEVCLVKLNKNYGFGKANNIGINIALKDKPDYIFLLNQDVYIEKGTLTSLLKIAEKQPEYAILGPMHLNGTGNAIDHHFSNYVSQLLISDTYLDKVKQLYPCQFINAAAWLVSSKCLHKVGGFDPIFFHYGEDVDYINRVQFHKLKVGICPLLRIYHDRGFYHSLATYPESKQLFIQTLQNLTNINNSLFEVVFDTYLIFFCKIFVDLFYLYYKDIVITIKVSFRILLKIYRIHKVRIDSQKQWAFLKKDHSDLIKEIIHKTNNRVSV